MAEFKVNMEDIKKLRDKTSAGVGLCKEALVATKGDMEAAVKYINDRSDVISRLNYLTGAKIGLCRVAFADAGDDFEKAVEIIKERGWANENVKGIENTVKEGIIEAYVHGTDHKTVALVEITCLTDFVASNEKFRTFAHEVAMQIAATKPKFVSKEMVPADKLAEMKELFTKEAQADNKPEAMMEKIIEGKLNKFYSENCLLEQKWFKDDSKTIGNLLDEAIGTFGEAMTIRRFMVWKLGE